MEKSAPILPSIVKDIQRPGVTHDELMSYYSEWATNYDKDYASLDYIGPKLAANTIMELYGDNKSAYILDCGAGTGLLGAQLHAAGFTHMDALDGSTAMLERAKERKVYDKLICAFMGPNKIPDVKDAQYDGLVSSGCFLEGHFQPDCLKEMIRIVKPGGYVVISTKAVALHEGMGKSQYLQDVEKAMQEHHDNNLWQWESTKVVEEFYLHYPGIIYTFRVGERSIGA